jgi:hypothetical protein
MSAASIPLALRRGEIIARSEALPLIVVAGERASMRFLESLRPTSATCKCGGAYPRAVPVELGTRAFESSPEFP